MGLTPKKIRTYAGVNFVIKTRRELGLHTQALSTVLIRSAQADTRGATQALDRGGQAAARGSCLSQVFGRGAEAIAHGAVS
jgi:hypothetical protein